MDKSIDPAIPSVVDSKLDPASVWEKVRDILGKELSEQSFRTWFDPVKCREINDSSVKLAVPDAYFGQWLKNHYENLIQSAIEEITGQRRSIDYKVEEPVKNPLVLPPSMKVRSVNETRESDLNSKYTFDDFVIGPGNRFAHAASLAVCEAPARQYNPLFIYGPVGLGKTHLMQSIAHEIKKKNPDFRVLYISSEKFTNQLITAIQTRSTHQFRNKYRSLDLLLIDDIHFLAEKEATQEEFFHTFNSLYDAHKQIVVSSDRPPKDIPGLEERLVSRFGWGLVTDIQPPDFETRVAILKKKMEKETVIVPDDVSFFIASKIRSNIRELEGALIRVVAYCTLTQQKLDLKATQEVLKDSFKEEEQKISIDQIQRVVAEFFHLKVSDLRAKRRSRSISGPRQIAMYIMREDYSISYPAIGAKLGGRDHTTVIHSCEKVKNDLKMNNQLVQEISQIRAML